MGNQFNDTDYYEVAIEMYKELRVISKVEECYQKQMICNTEQKAEISTKLADFYTEMGLF